MCKHKPVATVEIPVRSHTKQQTKAEQPVCRDTHEICLQNNSDALRKYNVAYGNKAFKAMRTPERGDIVQ